MSSKPLVKPAKYAEANTDEDATISHAAYDSYAAIMEEDSDNLDEEATWLRDQRRLHRSLHWLYRPSVIMVGLSIFMFAFAHSSAEGTRQMIQFRLGCNSIRESTGSEFCDPAQTQVLVLSLQQAYSFSLGIAMIVALGKVAPLSDKYGRKIFLMGIIVFQTLGKLSRFSLMSTYPTLQFALMVATEFLANCFGGIMTIITLANCYVSDIAEQSERTYYLGINMASLFVGMSTGPLVGNFIISTFKNQAINAPLGTTYGPGLSSADFAPLRFELIILVLLIFFVAFVLPESRGQDARRMSRSLSSAPLISDFGTLLKPSKTQKLMRSFNFLRPVRLIFYPKDSVHKLRHKTISSSRIAVLLLILTDCFVTSLAPALGEIYVLYGIYRFKWTAVDIGHLMAITCSSRAIVLVLVSPLLSYNFFQKTLGFQPDIRRFDKIEYGIVAIAFAFESVGQFLISVSTSGQFFLFCLVLNSIACLATPAINSTVVKFYPKSKTGEVFGAMAIVKNVFAIISPVATLGIYKASISKWNLPQTVFVIFSCIFFLLVVLMTYVIVILDKADSNALEADSVEEEM
ncbi:MFS general substrate transporter [Metschnikowia bicuspidata var. bicuspidata NRRL YB-4993]|uniref:MFS general substrate transporter n=1 Tax=Metschnikowia bicuspidata var. bicuspidata NRRL YB-4993 TaxID=869754 RepID=A0A1A0H7P1_9ASCO|nr:MFS general substrate transporter [Metschnikowia bicuspidata var. bicuspidata NRRL YB-4993]OBA20000.1 MFS general substrate transporter [Metschnikowia bicuspidata var. bicuspidata NRRL YB-4993]